ncbi:transcription antitermination factor NusB [bacterium]|nr:transcription antitermination factor NusB [bacterium]
MPNRHKSRELVVQFVYQWSINPCELRELAASAEFFWNTNTKLSDENKEYFLRVGIGAITKIPAIDERIESLLKNWKMSRVEKVDLAILRVAIFELNFEESEDKPDLAVVIDEAVEIAKKFGAKDSPSFVNGILDKAALK